MRPAISFWERYWGRADQLWAILFSLASVTIPEVFAKVQSAQSTFRFERDELKSFTLQKRFKKREVYAKNYCKADYNNLHCFSVTIFRLAIPAFFRFTEVTEWFTGFQVYRCTKEIARSSDIIASSYRRRKKRRSTRKTMH